jgi:hypothetical protein
MARPKFDPRFLKSSGYLNWHNLKGKTIIGVDIKTACNFVGLTFADNTYVEVHTTEIAGYISTPVLLSKE